MKKITALLLSVGMLFTVTACGGSNKVDDSALDKLETAIKNSTDIKSADYTMEATMKSSDTDDIMASIKGSYMTENEKQKFSMSLDMKQGQDAMEGYVKLFSDGDYIYANLLDMMKSKHAISSIGEQVTSLGFDKDTFTLPKEDMKKYLKTATFKGSTLTLELDPSKLKEELKKNEDTASMAEDMDINSAKLVATLTDDAITKAEFSGEFASKVDGKTETVNIVITFELTNVNAVKEITFPSFDDYQEASDTDLSALLGE